MQSRKTTILKIINAAIFIIMEIAALNMLEHNDSLQGFHVSESIHALMAKTWGASQGVKHYFSLNKENARLAQENSTLTGQLLDYENRFAQLSASVNDSALVRKSEFVYIPATIAKISINKQHNYIIIAKGSKDGITKNAGIITKDGVVGIVDAVGDNYSYALSFMNSEISISSRLGKTGAVGPLVWDGKHSNAGVLKEIPLQYKFQPGDTVFTSGYSSIFPADIPIGIVGKAKIVNGATNDISVKLLQNLKDIRFVTVVSNTGSKEIEGLENQEDKEGGR